MSHCPGTTLEDWLTDWYGLVVPGLDVGSGIRALYVGQRILTAEQFSRLVAIHESIREYVEDRSMDYNEEDHGSWRTYRDGFNVPDGISEAADRFLEDCLAPRTVGIARYMS